MRSKQTTKNTLSKTIQSPLKPLILGLCSLGLLSGCSQLPKTFSETTNSSNSSKLTTSTDLRHSSLGQIKPTFGTSLLGLDSKQEIHQRAITDPSELADQAEEPVFYANIWDEIASDLQMGDQHYSDFSGYVSYYKKKPNYLKRVSKRAQPYMHFIFSEVKNRNMPYEMALLPIIESGFQVKAKSHQSAVGLWQFIPQTGHLYGLDQNWWYDGRQNIVQSTEAALTYLKKLHDLNNDDWLLALASYNGGIGNVWKAVKKYKKKHPEVKQPNFWQIRPYLPKETQHYVPQLLAVAHTIKNRTEFKQYLEPIDNTPYFKVSKLKKQISLDKVASLSGTPSELLAKLNPGYLRPATPPNGPFNIVLPTEKFELFQNQLASDSSVFDIQWTKHKIRSGDTLGEIAQKYKTSSKAIKKLNNMRNSKIRVGKTLLIPLPQQYAKAFNSDSKPKSSYKGPKFNHTVKSGESLWTIARYYNTDTKTLCNWNNIGVRTPLRKGQKLEIRSGKYGHQQTYTLKNGDSLWTVAKKFGVTTTELSKWNKIKRSKILQPGMKLTVWQPQSKNSKTARLLDSKQFKHYTVKSGDSLWNIAKANKLSTKVIARYNQIPEKAFLKPGQVLKIPYDQNT
ncbi:MAG: LysM peptidoglycan-binding domain-containing protein [Pseudomonadota bacterium]|nr:LysM peptidoglycan-binding domain-containing protein [Pseudomonadota bacterium]